MAEDERLLATSENVSVAAPILSSSEKRQALITTDRPGSINSGVIASSSASAFRSRSSSDPTDNNSFSTLLDDPSFFLRQSRRRLNSRSESMSDSSEPPLSRKGSSKSLFDSAGPSNSSLLDLFEDLSPPIRPERQHSPASVLSSSQPQGNDSEAQPNSSEMQYNPISSILKASVTAPPGLGHSPSSRPKIHPRSRPRAQNVLTEMPEELYDLQAGYAPPSFLAISHSTSPRSAFPLQMSPTRVLASVSAGSMLVSGSSESGTERGSTDSLDLPSVCISPRRTKKQPKPRSPKSPRSSSSIKNSSPKPSRKRDSKNDESLKLKASPSQESVLFEIDEEPVPKQVSWNQASVPSGSPGVAASNVTHVTSQIIELGLQATTPQNELYGSFFSAASMLITTEELYSSFEQEFAHIQLRLAEDAGSFMLTSRLEALVSLLCNWLSSSYREELKGTEVFDQLSLSLSNWLNPADLTRARWAMRCNDEIYTMAMESGSSESLSLFESRSQGRFKLSGLRKTGLGPTQSMRNALSKSNQSLRSECRLTEIDPLLFCEELSFIEHRRMSLITRNQLFTAAWESADSETEVRFIIQQWNKFSLWIQHLVVSSVQLKLRVELLKRLILTMSALLDNGNYISLFSLLMSLEAPSISRLRRTWRALPPKYFSLYTGIKDLMSPLNNHWRYRQHLEQRIRTSMPFVPLLGLVFRDLSIILQTNPDRLDGQPNVQKLILVGKIIRLVENAQRRRYIAGPMHSSEQAQTIRSWVSQSPDIVVSQADNFEEVLWSLSRSCEPNTAADV